MLFADFIITEFRNGVASTAVDASEGSISSSEAVDTFLGAESFLRAFVVELAGLKPGLALVGPDCTEALTLLSSYAGGVADAAAAYANFYAGGPPSSLDSAVTSGMAADQYRASAAAPISSCTGVTFVVP